MINQIIAKILELLPVGKYVIFESVPDLSDNTKAVFDKMMELGLNEKYKFVWFVSDKRKKFALKDGIKYIDRRTRINRLLYKYYTSRAKCLICCNQFTGTKTKKQKSFYLTHGTAIKSIRESSYQLPKNIDYVLVASEGTKGMMAYEFKADESIFYAFGYPRNDVFKNTDLDLRRFFTESFDKIIAWYPTFRQHKGGKKTACPNALPILYDLDQAMSLNSYAATKKILIVIKPHFAQDISYIQNYNLSNIVFIDDDFFVKRRISSYEFVGNCDALVTDYSSIYYDYLLNDKPIALVWEDVEQYRQNPGFAVDIDYIGKGAEKIYTLDDFKLFIDKVSDEIDSLKEDRREINKWANYSTDGKNAERVVQFIIEKANLI